MPKLARFVAAALAVLALGGPPAYAQPPAGGPPAPPVLDTTLAFPDGVTLHGDVIYASPRGYRPLTLDLYLPKSKGPVPLVVFVHGGAWAGGSSRSAEIIGDDFPKMFAALSARGYAVASINYRLSSEARFPAPVQDLNAALRFLRAKAADYGIDDSRVVLWGASAGAQISMLSAFDCKAHALDPAGGSTCVTAVVDWFGPTNLMPAAEPSATSLAYLGCKPAECADAWKKASPINALSGAAPPFLIVHGDADTTVPLAQSQALLQALTALKVKAELKVVPGGNHLFRGAARPEIDAAIARTFAFIDEQTKGGAR